MNLKLVRQAKRTGRLFEWPSGRANERIAPGQRQPAEEGRERRGDTRHRTEDRVCVEVSCGSLLHVEGKALDISDHGLRLELESPLSKGMPVQVTFAEGELILFGELQYCRPAAHGYCAGVRVANVAVGTREDRHCGEDDLILYLGAEGLTSAEVVRLQQHLNHCPACRARLDEEKRVLDRIGPKLMALASGYEHAVPLPGIA